MMKCALYFIAQVLRVFPDAVGFSYTGMFFIRVRNYRNMHSLHCFLSKKGMSLVSNGQLYEIAFKSKLATRFYEFAQKHMYGQSCEARLSWTSHSTKLVWMANQICLNLTVT